MKAKPSERDASPPFEVREGGPAKANDPTIGYLYAEMPKSEISSFKAWMGRHGVRKIKTAVRFAVWYMVTHDVEPPSGGSGVA